MKASELLSTIREDIKDYPIEYLRNKVTDERYKDPLTKKLAKYNSETYDEIYAKDIEDDFEIKDGVIDNVRSDVTFYFENYAGGDDDQKKLTENLSLYLALIAKRPLHPVGEDKKEQVYFANGSYYCKERVKSIRDERSLCRYCVCKNPGFADMF